MNNWTHRVDVHSRERIQQAVNDRDWQNFRLSLKGLPTTEKLARLENYLYDGGKSPIKKVRVDNYINALLRGGQLKQNFGRIEVQR